MNEIPYSSRFLILRTISFNKHDLTTYVNDFYILLDYNFSKLLSFNDYLVALDRLLRIHQYHHQWPMYLQCQSFGCFSRERWDLLLDQVDSDSSCQITFVLCIVASIDENPQ